MRLVIAWSPSRHPSRRIVDRLQQHLTNHFEVEILTLPQFEEAEPIRTAVGFRLIPPIKQADALLCLDAAASVLRHPRKLVWLTTVDDVATVTKHRSVVANLMAAGVSEAKTLYVSPSLLKKAKSPEFKMAIGLSPLDLGKAATGALSPIARLMQDLST